MKKTKIGWIPEDWESATIGSCCCSMYQGINTTADKVKYVDDGIKIIQTKHITSGKIEFSTARQISKELYRKYCEKFNPSINDLLVSNIGTIGNVILIEKNIQFLMAWNLFLLKLNEKIIPVYLYHWLKHLQEIDYYSKLLTGNATKFINKSQMSLLPLHSPPLPEQKKIASILTTVDDKISSIDQQIQQTEQLKKGLMEKLLTEGIGHTEFKETKIGRIPKGWDVVQFGKASVNFDGKRIPIKSEDRQNMQGEYPYYGAQGIIDYVNDYIFDGEYLLIAEDGENVKSRKNDIAFYVKGRFWVNNHAHIVQANASSTIPFLRFVLNHIDIKKFITGMAQPKLNQAKLNSIPIPLPPIEEQKQIASILSSVDDKIEVLNQKKTQHQTLKKGLSQQLLTGQMRVKI